MSFIDVIKERARKSPKNIVLVETSDIRTLEAAAKVQKEGFAKITLVGDEEQILQKISPSSAKTAVPLDFSKLTIINPKTSDLVEKYADLFVQLRAHKGMTREMALNLLLNDPLYFGVALLKDDKADGMVAGAINSTANVLRAALQIVGTAKDAKIVSSCFLMVVPESEYGLKFGTSGIFVFSDCALIQEPSSEELAQIATQSAKSFASFTGGEPIVALLSHSTYGSAKHAKVDKVLGALDILKSAAPDLKVDGELQLDAAIIPSVGRAKAPKSKIAGSANVLIFPDIDAGNIGYKLVQRLGKAEAYGPMTQGLAKPINDLSRGCSSDDIVGTIAITALQAAK